MVEMIAGIFCIMFSMCSPPNLFHSPAQGAQECPQAGKCAVIDQPIVRRVDDATTQPKTMPIVIKSVVNFGNGQKKDDYHQSHLSEIDMLFFDYDPEQIKAMPAVYFSDALFEMKCSNISTTLTI